MKTKFINVHAIDYSKDFKGEILTEEGKIIAIGETLEDAEEVIDCENFVLMPAFVDLHAHFRDPGFPEKETIESGEAAALQGGYTFVNVMANTMPVCSHLDLFLENNAKFKLIDGNQTVSLTENFDGKTLAHLWEFEGVAKVVSEDGKGIRNSLVLTEALKMLSDYDMLLMVHAEDMDISGVDYRLGENLETLRDIAIAESVKGRIHFSHVSTKEAISMIREAKRRKVRVTCEVTPHHIFFRDLDYKVNPPIRSSEDVKEIIEGIKDGTVDAIATDHAPHTEENKRQGSPGMVGLETAFGAVNKVFQEENISLQKLSCLMSKNPSDILKINKGRLDIGYDADFVLVDPNKKWTVDREKFKSKSKNSPFHGLTLTGQVKATFKAGKKLY